MLDLSSKRSSHDGHLRHDMPYLEFNQYFKNIHGQTVLPPHEMSWSLDQFMHRMVDIKDQMDAKVESIMDQRYAEVSKAFKTLEDLAE